MFEPLSSSGEKAQLCVLIWFQILETMVIGVDGVNNITNQATRGCIGKSHNQEILQNKKATELNQFLSLHS